MKKKSTFELVVYENENMGRIDHYYGTEAEMYDLANEMYDKGYFCRLYYIWSDGHRTEM